MDEGRFGRDLETSGRGLIEVVPAFTWMDWEKTRKISFIIVDIVTDIRINHVPNTNKEP
jgi:hypothetical protein